MKKTAAIVLILAMAITLTACGGGASRVEKGDIITLGGYEWLVLDVADGTKALVISDKILELRPFDSSDNDWETSDIRKYLNGEFYENTFTAAEKRKIIETEVANVGNNTTDKVFLLSSGEASTERYFATDASRIAMNISDGQASNWWLRSPGRSSRDAANVGNDGNVNVYGIYIYVDDNLGVRPALWLNP